MTITSVCKKKSYFSNVQLSVKWPKWAYTLVKPYYGCPPGWYQGWTFQDNEDSANKNYISYGHHFAGKILNDFLKKKCNKPPFKIIFMYDH